MFKLGGGHLRLDTALETYLNPTKNSLFLEILISRLKCDPEPETIGSIAKQGGSWETKLTLLALPRWGTY